LVVTLFSLPKMREPDFTFALLIPPPSRIFTFLQVMLVGPSDTMYEGGFFKVRSMLRESKEYIERKGAIFVVSGRVVAWRVESS